MSSDGLRRLGAGYEADEAITMKKDVGGGGLIGTIYYTLRGIMITIGITPPPPGKEKWVAVVFFGACALFLAGMIMLGALLLRNMS